MQAGRSIPVLILIILLLIPFHRVITGNGYITGIDSFLQYVEPYASHFPDAKTGAATFACDQDGLLQTVPSKYFTRQQLKEGRIPLWNPYIFCGTPHQADMYSQVFSITDTPLLYIMSIDAALTVAAILKLLILGLGMYLIARRFAIRWEFAIIPAIVMVFNFQQMLWLEIPAFLSTSLYLPWMFLAWDKFLVSKKFHWLFLCALLGGLAGLGGQAQLFATIWIILFLYTMFSGRKDFRINRAAGFGTLAVAFALSTAIAWVQFYPALEFVALSKGPSPSPSIAAHFAGAAKSFIAGGWKQIGINTVRLVLPYSYHKAGPDFYAIYKELVLYLGFLSPALILALWRRGRSRFAGYLWWVALISMLLIIFNVIVETLLGALPFTQFQNLRRMAALAFNFHMALLLPLVLNEIVTNLDIHRLNRVRLMTFIFPALAGIYCTYKFLHFLFGGGTITDSTGVYFLIFYAVAFFIWLAYLALLREKHLKASFFPLLILCIFFLEIWNFSSHLIIVSRTTSDELSQLDAKSLGIDSEYGRVFRLIRDDAQSEAIPFRPNTGMLAGIYDAQGYNPLNLYSYRKLFSELGFYQKTNPREIPYLVEDHIQSFEYLEPLHVRWILSSASDRASSRITDASYLFAVEDLSVGINASNRDQWLNAFTEAEYTIVNDNYVEIDRDSPHSQERVSINFTEREPGLTTFNTEELMQPMLVLYPENNYPGWHANIDGQPAELLTIDGTFMGVELDAGSHTVELAFNPPRFRTGLITSIITLLLVACLGILAYSFKK